MKPATFVALLLFVSVSVFAQNPYEEFIEAFRTNYNNQNYEAIHNLTSDGFKAKVSKEYLAQILGGGFTAAGKITDVKIAEEATQGKVYHLICERETLALSVSLDASGKAAGLLIRPVEKSGSKDPASIISKWKASNANAGLVVGRLRDGQPDIQYLGVIDKERSQTPDAQSIFEIGSISKPFTGILLHTLIAEGKISLDDPINKFLPKTSQIPKVKDKDVLIRHLVSHSSCLPRMPGNFNPPAEEASNPYNYYSEKDLFSFLPTITTGDCELGTLSVYSNLGAGLLGYILTKVSGKPYTELFNERIAKPLKTKSFGVVGMSDKWVKGHTSTGASQSQWTFTDVLVGAGGVDACADDMVKVLSFLMKPDQSRLGKAVNASTVAQLQGAQGTFATFWVRQQVGSKTVIWHNGMTGGFNAFVGWIEGTQTGVFILSNNGEDVATGLGLAMLGE